MNPTLGLAGDTPVPLPAGSSGKPAAEDTAASVTGSSLFAGLMAGQDSPPQMPPGPVELGFDASAGKVGIQNVVTPALAGDSPGAPPATVAVGEAAPIVGEAPAGDVSLNHPGGIYAPTDAQAGITAQSTAVASRAETAVPDEAQLRPAGGAGHTAPAEAVVDVASPGNTVNVAPDVAPEQVVAVSPRSDVDAACAAQKPTLLQGSLQLRDLHPSPGNMGADYTAPTSAASVTSQVLRAVGPTVLGGGEQVTIHLDPEELGRVEVRFHATGNRLAVTIVASGAEAERMLREGAKELSDVISQRSARFQTVEVRVEMREQENRQDTRQDGRREETSHGSGREDGDGRRKSGKQPHTTAAAWADLALGG